MTPQPVYSTSNGVPHAAHPYASQYAAPGGPLLLQDFNLIDTISHFDRERIPERVVHAKGGGAHGFFECTDSLEDLSYARIFQTPGYKCPVSCRFSTVGGESGTPDTARDPRGFSIKFKTDMGNMDWVFNNTPIFFIRDPLKFPHFIHTQKRDPATHLTAAEDSSRFWDYLVQNPESIHQVTYMMGPRGIPKSWAQMNGYSGHTFKLLNAKGELTYAQFHILADDGTDNYSEEEGGAVSGAHPDHNIKDLRDRIDEGKFPSWTYYVQTMTPKQAEEFRYSVNDLTKIWSKKDFPLRKFGRMVLDKNPDNYFAEIEQLAFSPSHLLPGIEPSNDPVLQSRLFSYPDTHRHRLGTNYQQLPANKPRTTDPRLGCPFFARNFQRDGAMTMDNQGSLQDYISLEKNMNSMSNDPTTFAQGIPNIDEGKFVGVVPSAAENKYEVMKKEMTKRHHEDLIYINHFEYISGFSELDVEQPRALYEKVFSDEERKAFVDTVVGHASTSRPQIKEKVPAYFGLLNKDLGAAIAKGLGVKYTHCNAEEYISFVGAAPTH